MGEPGKAVTSFDAVQASEVLARTYGNVAQGENIPQAVADRLPEDPSASSVESRVGVAPVEETQLLEIEAEDRDPRGAQLLANTYADVFRRYISTLPEAGSSTVAVSNPAAVPRSPSRPQPGLYSALGAFVGLLLGLGLVFLLERLDTRIRSSEELAELVGAPVLTHLPKLSGSPASQASYDDAAGGGRPPRSSP